MFRTEDIDCKERADRQHHRDSDISRHIRASGEERNQSHHVIDKDEKERCQQIWRELPVVRSDTTLDDIVVHHHDEHLHESDKSSRCFGSLRTFPVPMCHTQHDNEQQYAVEQQGKRHFRNGNIPRANLFACGVILYQFAFIFTSFGSDGKSFISPSILFETGRKERVPT